MRILLVGEYSRLHNSLKEGLQALGHQVTILGSGDAFKNYPVDLLLERGFESGWRKKLKVGILRVTRIDISAIALRRKFKKLKPKLRGYDVVQLINESSFLTTPELELEIAQYLKAHNNKLFLLSCGADVKSISYIQTGKLPYSILTPLEKGKGNTIDFDYALKYNSTPFKELHKKLYNLVDGIIATDLDYHIPYKGDQKYLGLIPNPVNTDAINFERLNLDNQIVIFQGINSKNYFAKGQDIFSDALEIVQQKVGDKIEIISTQNIPYLDYMSTYSKCHILLDQVYSQDQGYNALEAMARGKVVFTGAGKEFTSYYNLNNTVAIDATPDAQEIATRIIDLINNREQLREISCNARKFIEENHDYKKVAQCYLDTWTR